MAHDSAARGVDTLVTADEAGRLFGITGRQVQSLAAQGVIPKAARGQYRLGDIIPGYLGTLRAREEKRRIAVAREKYMRLRTDELQVRLDQRLGKLRAEAEQHAATIVEKAVAVLKTHVSAIPARSTRNVEVRDAIEREVRCAFDLIDARLADAHARHFEAAPPCSRRLRNSER